MPPAHSGFGSFLIERVLKSEGGEAHLDYKPRASAPSNYPTYKARYLEMPRTRREPLDRPARSNSRPFRRADEVIE
jgi:hypothetical protein